jgi:hypothetical protein
VDAGHGWLVFALRPGETAFLPSADNGPHELYFMCDDLKAEMSSLAMKGVNFSAVQEARWGVNYADASSRWRQGRPLSAKASDCIERGLK